MDLRAMLNNDPPAASPSQNRQLRPPPPPQRPQLLHDHQPPRNNRQPPPPSPYASPSLNRYEPSTPQRHQNPPQPGYPFPHAPQSPIAQHRPPPPQLQQQPGYQLSPVSTPHGTPHPLSAHSGRSKNTPTTIVSPSPLGHIAHSHHYGPPPQQPLRTPPPQSPRYGPQTQLPGYPPGRSPLASPVQQRANLPPDFRRGPIEPRPYPNNEPAPASTATPRGRQTPQHLHDRDVSISPKTKVSYLAHEDGQPLKREHTYGVDFVDAGPLSRPQAHPGTPLGPPSLLQRSPSHSRHGSVSAHSVDTMDFDNGHANERQWSSPSSERAKPNGSEIRDGQAQGQVPVHTQPHSITSPVHPTAPPRGRSPPAKDSPQQQQEPASRQFAPAPRRSTPSASPAYSRTSTSQAQTTLNPKPPLHQALGPPPTPTPPAQQAHHHQNHHHHHNMDARRTESSGSSGPPRKRARREEPPIWARKVGSVSVPVRRQLSSTPSSAHPPGPATASIEPPRPSVSQPPPSPGATGPPVNHPGIAVIPAFGPWEKSIAGTEPFEELTRCVTDFLWTHVVAVNDPALVNGGPDGPVIEIEAKFGHLVDYNTNERLKLPVTTETVMSQDSGVRFKSSMSEAQHKALNEYLNGLVNMSRGTKPANPTAKPSPPRIRIEYVHTRERDSFYELPSDKYNLLPPSIRESMRNKTPRIRVSTDPKTNQVINKIVKMRIADLNVYSPKTPFDWRVSVNMEMPYMGDVEALVKTSEGERNKDRVSYKHLCYQVDITRVADAKGKKEHELEVELDGAELRRHGLLHRDQKPNSYETLVKGLVDNVRVLNRYLTQVR